MMLVKILYLSYRADEVQLGQECRKLAAGDCCRIQTIKDMPKHTEQKANCSTWFS